MIVREAWSHFTIKNIDMSIFAVCNILQTDQPFFTKLYCGVSFYMCSSDVLYYVAVALVMRGLS